MACGVSVCSAAWLGVSISPRLRANTVLSALIALSFAVFLWGIGYISIRYLSAGTRIGQSLAAGSEEGKKGRTTTYICHSFLEAEMVWQVANSIKPLIPHSLL